MFNTDTQYKGSLKIERILPNGERVVELEKHNLVVQTGKNYGVSRLISNTEFGVLASIGVGSGTVAPAIGDTALGTQLANQVFDSAATRSTNSISATTTFGPGVGTGSITEAGLFNGISGGAVMFSRSTFAAIPKGASDTIAVTWTVTAS